MGDSWKFGMKFFTAISAINIRPRAGGGELSPSEETTKQTRTNATQENLTLTSLRSSPWGQFSGGAAASPVDPYGQYGSYYGRSHPYSPAASSFYSSYSPHFGK